MNALKLPVQGIGAITGDIIGSRFEKINKGLVNLGALLASDFNTVETTMQPQVSGFKSKEFELFHPECRFTDDSVLTLAVMCALMDSKPDWSDLSNKAGGYMRKLATLYPRRDYGGGFLKWVRGNSTQAYNSYGNGAAMRVSGCGFIGKTLDEVKMLSHKVTYITHSHPEGLKGAEATAVAVFLARTNHSKQEIKEFIQKNYYQIDFKLSDIRETYTFDVTCQGTVPPALVCFFEATDFEDTIRNAVSLGGDSDTLCSISGAVAGAYYGVPEELQKQTVSFFDENFIKVIGMFQEAVAKANNTGA